MTNPGVFCCKNADARTGWITSISQHLVVDFYYISKSSASAMFLQIEQIGNLFGSLDGTNSFPQMAITGLPMIYPSVTEAASA